MTRGYREDYIPERPKLMLDTKFGLNQFVKLVTNEDMMRITAIMIYSDGSYRYQCLAKSGDTKLYSENDLSPYEKNDNCLGFSFSINESE